MIWAFHLRVYDANRVGFKPRYPPLWPQGPNVKRKFYTMRGRAQGRKIQMTKPHLVGFDFPDKIFSKKNWEIDGEVPTSLTVAKTHISKKPCHPTPFLGGMMGGG